MLKFQGLLLAAFFISLQYFNLGGSQTEPFKGRKKASVKSRLSVSAVQMVSNSLKCITWNNTAVPNKMGMQLLGRCT